MAEQNKKRFRISFGGCLGLLASLVTVIIFITGKQYLPEIISPLTRLLNNQPPNAPTFYEMKAGFEKLDNFRMNYNLAMSGTDEQGVAVSQQLRVQQDTIRSKENISTSIRVTGVPADIAFEALDLYQVSKNQYFTVPSKPDCKSMPVDNEKSFQSQLLSPDSMLAGLKSDKLVAGGEIVNGLKTNHFKLSHIDLSFGEATSQVSDIWVSQDDNYLVKFVGQAEGDFSVLGGKVKGTLAWEYNLSEINQLKEIVLPPDCAKLAADIMQGFPIPSNAFDKSLVGENVTFSSPDNPKIVGDFFRKELLNNGWTIPNSSNLDTSVTMTALKGTRKFTIMITPGKNSSGAVVVITKVLAVSP